MLYCFAQISISRSFGFWYHGNGQEARHLFRNFKQKSDSCNISGFGRQPDRVPSRGWHPNPAMSQLSDFCSKSRNKCFASCQFPWYRNPTLPETEILGKTGNDRGKKSSNHLLAYNSAYQNIKSKKLSDVNRHY